MKGLRVVQVEPRVKAEVHYCFASKNSGGSPSRGLAGRLLLSFGGSWEEGMVLLLHCYLPLLLVG